MRSDLVAENNIITFRTEIPWDVSDFIFLNRNTDNEKKYYENYFYRNFTIKQGVSTCEVLITTLEISEDEGVSSFNGNYICPVSIGNLDEISIHNSLFSEEFVNWDHFVNFSIGDEKWELVFTKQKTEYPGTVNSKYSVNVFNRLATVAKDFIRMGIVHIFTGYDHILFLLSTILLLRSLKRILLLVTSFTIAHSVTLILAGFKIIEISPRLVEPAIALSIVYIAFRNIQLLRSQEQPQIKERWVTTFGFGLIHGLGFASILTQTQIPEGYFVPSLILFNVGIEIGQLLILSVIIPLLFQLDKYIFSRKVLLISSGFIGILALFWVAQRTFLAFI